MNEFEVIGYADSWKRIALMCGRSDRWCRYMAQREEDPLPVFKLGGMVRLNVADWQAWLVRQGEQRQYRKSKQTRPAIAGRNGAAVPRGGETDEREARKNDQEVQVRDPADGGGDGAGPQASLGMGGEAAAPRA